MATWESIAAVSLLKYFKCSVTTSLQENEGRRVSHQLLLAFNPHVSLVVPEMGSDTDTIFQEGT